MVINIKETTESLFFWKKKGNDINSIIRKYFNRKDTWDLCDMINQEKDPIVTKKIAKELLKALKKEAPKKAQRNSYYWETCEDSNRNYFDAIEELKEEIIGSTKTRI